MKRYNITSETEFDPPYTGAALPRIKITEADNGEWIRYEDVQAEIRNAFFYAINEGFFGKAYDDAWEEYVRDGFPRYE